MGRRLGDVVGFALATVLGICSLPLPFGRDQGLYFYVAREWALRGSIPYRDVFDHKPPGIYLIHRLALHLFGEVQWGIRVLDFVCVICASLVVARLATPVGSAIRPGTRGLAALSTAVIFYGIFNYWDGAQSEIYYATLGCGAIAAARHVVDLRKAAILTGALSGAAMVVKPPVVWFLLLAVLALGLRAWREDRRGRIVAALAYALGAAVPLAVTFGYFGAQHALGAMADVVVGANGYYVAHEHSVTPIADALDGSQIFLVYCSPIASAVLLTAMVTTWVASRRPDRGRLRQYAWAWGFVLAAYAATFMQMKFYLLHWVPMVLALAILATMLLEELRDALAPLARPRTSTFVAFGLVLGAWLGSAAGRKWTEQQIATARYVRGIDSRERFTSRFAFPEIHFSYAESEWVGGWLREHTQPDDFVAVRGFEPEVYAVARRRHSGRFFWTTFLTVPARAYRRAEYLAEDRAAFEGPSRPRYAVARADTLAEYADSVPYMEGLGYSTELVHGSYVIMRDASSIRERSAAMRTSAEPTPESRTSP